MPTRKTWNHIIELKEGFVLRNEKIYFLSREEREKIRNFIQEQIKKEYVWLLKLPQNAPVFFVRKKKEEIRMV